MILLDEIEKAHPDVFNILLQVLDDGRLTDNKGRVADFRNTILIMTSNMGSHLIQESMQEDINDPLAFDKTKSKVMELLRQTIRPEFLNRIDEIIMFHALTPENVREILKLQVDKISEMLRTKGIRMELTERHWLFGRSKGMNLHTVPTVEAAPATRTVNELARKLEAP